MLLRRIADAVDAGDGASALVSIEEHGRVYPQGALVEEREAARILALCALGRRDAAVEAAVQFRARYPRSMSAQRLRTSCARQSP